MNRASVVCLAGGNSSIKSNQFPLRVGSFERFRIKFSFYAIEMKHTDDLCLDYELGDGAVTGRKCWSSLHAFENSRWYDGKSFEFAASNAESLKV